MKYTLIDAKENKSITAEFLLSYILPLFAFDFTLWSETVKFLIFFFTFGYLCIYHNFFTVNIILEFLNYRVYECTITNSDNQKISKSIISKNSLSVLTGNELIIKHINNDYCFDFTRKS